MSNGRTRPTYILSCNGVVLLTLDAELSPPFAIGQHVELVNVRRTCETDHNVDCYIVIQVRRRIGYHTTPVHGDRVPLVGQEVTVELERLHTTEEKNHG